MSTQFSALVSKLKEIFQINRPDLDFGVYRILNARSDEIAEFLDKRLKTKVEQYLGEAKSSLDESAIKELEAELKAEFGKRAFNEQGELIDVEAIESELGQKYIALTQADAHEMTDQSQVYSHLLTFFSRYYDDGDFISQRRYKGDTYAIPYSGEEVMLHWANKDQYYTKSGEMFSNYRFKLNDERSVLFRLVSADTARENRKDNDKDRRFIIVTEPKTFIRVDEEGEEFEETIVPFSIQNNELTILFEYATLPKGSKQEALNTESHNKILTANVLTSDWLNDLAQPAPTEKEPKRTVLQKHLSTYTQKNTADYFIHKDLGKFLRHELDFYIKNEVMHLDDVVSVDQFIQIERQLSIIKCLRQIGLEIISFLASLEDFQKKLWLKKKFVVSAEYCITLDRVDESLYAEIAENTAQWQQWEDLGFKGTDAGWGAIEYLKQHQALMVDTSLFSLEFKAKLLQKIDNLDAQTDGLIINSDNFQALNLLSGKYKQSVNCIYIDPPYNAKSSEILYKNTFKHSAFLTFISNRLEVATPFLQSGGLVNIAIDDYEQKGVITVCDEIFGSNNFISNVVVQHNPRGRNDDKFYGTSHEYMIVYTNHIENANLGNFTLSDDDKSIYRLTDNISKYQEVSFMRTGNNSDRVTRPNLFYPIYLDKKTNLLSLDKSDDSIEILPINSSNEEKTWRWERKTFLEKKDTEVSFKISEDGVRLYKKRRLLDVGKKPKTIWFDSKYDASSSGIMFLRNFFSKDNQEFSYPKSIYTVKDAVYISSPKNGVILDYFAGSGTTAHATIALNREDNGNRKYILVEQGEYFDTVIKPRIQKVVYSADWKEGKPINPESGISHCLKVGWCFKKYAETKQVEF